MVRLTIDGMTVKVPKGTLVIEAARRLGVMIPHFCYHPKLKPDANCRMCLVEVEKAPKPLPACATPVAEGMKIFTKSPNAIGAQKATMEFLLINHPLDCPICDQGGECELQDLAVGFGRDVSRFHERKRVVKDESPARSGAFTTLAERSLTMELHGHRTHAQSMAHPNAGSTC
ncbi:MAG: 2Fe-2S iron-sulfur cluster binding domain-containing protein [Nitrospiraceae bacterium]|nr:2Fe-2S iron-sulfur cluster binding domain-containing protein [Nitrospiraceae bacterium]